MIKLNPTVGIFSDIHLGLGQDSDVWHENVLEFAEWAVKIYKQKNITQILIPGDIFHNRNEISVNTLKIASDFFNIFKKNEFTLLISTGNHDCYYKDRSDINSITLLKGWNNIILIDSTPISFDIHGSTKKLSMIPWGTSLEDIPKTDICVGHFEIESFKMNSYKDCTHGMKSEHLLNKSPFIISGHFHRRAFRVYQGGHVLYLGSPYQQNFGDIDDSRGIYSLNLSDNTFEFIQNDISPKHIKVLVSDILTKKKTIKELANSISNNMVSVVVDSALLPEEISLITSKLQSLKPRFFRIEYQENIMDSNNPIVNGMSYDSIDIVKNLEDFIQDLDIKHKKETFTYLEELYNKLI